MVLPPVATFTPRVAAGAFALWRWELKQTVFWGVDSLDPVNQAFFDALKAKTGAPPVFWGRYVGSKEGNLSQTEVDSVLHKNNCKVLVIYNGTYAKYDGKQRVSTYADGVFHANDAMQYIKNKKLAVPQNKSVWIYLDTEFGSGVPALPADFSAVGSMLCWVLRTEARAESTAIR